MVTTDQETYLTSDEVIKLLEEADESKFIAVDTETSTSNHPEDDFDIRDGSGYANGISFAYLQGGITKSCYLPFRHITTGGNFGENLDNEVLQRIRTALEAFQGIIFFHHAKFDLESLRTLGINYRGRFICTMQLAHLINEERPFSKSLNEVSSYYINDPGKKQDVEFEYWKKLFGWKRISPNAMEKYAAYDANITIRLGLHLISLPGWDEDLQKYWWEQKWPFYEVICTMERRGVRINTDICEKMITVGESQLEEITELLGFNVGSNKQLGEYLIKTLKLPVVKINKVSAAKKAKGITVGNPSFDKEAMKEYEAMLELQDDPSASLILEYRGWQKSVSSNYRPYIELLSADGRLRPNYKLHGTKTGRMSCEKPNLQQIPRVSDKTWNGAMKSAFIPADGYSLFEADYAQLELRLATAYARDDGLKKVFNEDRDVFTEMSQDLGMVRQDCKTLTYTIQYGGGVSRLTNVFSITPDRASALRDNFYRTYPGFRAVADLAKRTTESCGRVQLWSGRYRHFSFPRDESHKAFNSVIQGGAADIVERSMLRCFREIDDEIKCRMLLQVHDSIVFEIRNDCIEEYLPKIKQVMEAIPEEFDVKFAVDVHPWGE